MRMLLLFSEKYAPELLSNDEYFIPIKNTMDNLVSVQLPDGNMPTDINGSCASEYGNDTDARVQWCHGAPGFTDLFTYASFIFQSINTTAAEVYLQSGLLAANVTWTRGLIVKGFVFLVPTLMSLFKFVFHMKKLFVHLSLCEID
ncbi:hypothetical protein RFI_07716 [Reticulomyxa filosa]|uniref:Uncharacterized protein n=1 Tax=Reticulomyxa filosa TaxID=46433 RepID=X6NT11_RETFI|nr:hypothetical protein RFI_07716 [Reticulomyxa filosa]|eukprot:ETO29405.1 hypothetical protein RFI_07716 [Reticulomyxa filosa]